MLSEDNLKKLTQFKAEHFPGKNKRQKSFSKTEQTNSKKKKNISAVSKKKNISAVSKKKNVPAVSKKKNVPAVSKKKKSKNKAIEKAELRRQEIKKKKSLTNKRIELYRPRLLSLPRYSKLIQSINSRLLDIGTPKNKIINLINELELEVQYVPNEYKAKVRSFINSKRTELELEIIKVKWEILPHGEGVSGINRWISIYATKNNIDSGDIRKEYTEFLYSKMHNPLIYIGKYEFDGYIVLKEENSNCAICECPFSGNATYIFKGSWQILTRYSKSELINNKEATTRLYHTETWASRIVEFL